MFWLIKPKYRDVYFAQDVATKEGILNHEGGYFTILDHEPTEAELDKMVLDYYM